MQERSDLGANAGHWARVVYVSSVGLTLAAIVAEPLTIFDGIEKLLSGWRDFTRSVVGELISAIPGALRPYDATVVRDVLTVELLLIGALSRSTPLRTGVTMEQALSDVKTQRLELGALHAIITVVVLVPMAKILSERGAFEFHAVFWAVAVVAIALAMSLFGVVSRYSRERLSPERSYMYWRVVLGFGFLGCLSLLGLIALARNHPPEGFAPINERQWRMSITSVALTAIFLSQFGLLAARRSLLLIYVVAVAAAIVVIGATLPIIRQGFVDAGWIT